MHSHVTHNRYHPDFRTFAEAMMRFFKTTLPDKWHEIRDTVNDNFHIIRPEKFRVVRGRRGITQAYQGRRLSSVPRRGL